MSNDKIPMLNKIQNPNALKNKGTIITEQKDKRMNDHESMKSEKHDIITGFQFKYILHSRFRNFACPVECVAYSTGVIICFGLCHLTFTLLDKRNFSEISSCLASKE